MFLTMTVAEVTIAPVASETVPLIFPVSAWPNITILNPSTKKTRVTNRAITLTPDLHFISNVSFKPMGRQPLPAMALRNPKSGRKHMIVTDVQRNGVKLQRSRLSLRIPWSDNWPGNTTEHYNPRFATEFNKYDGICNEISYLSPP